MSIPLKKQSTIGCCGIDCGLCPRFHTKGISACPGCGGPNFKEKHPSCGFVTCCVVKNQLEVCGNCSEYPCIRFDSEKQGFDSFVTHKKVFENLNYIRTSGLNVFIKQQNQRIRILNKLIASFDDGRSKSLFCISSALLPLDKLQETLIYAENLDESIEIKGKGKLIRDKLQAIAESLGIELKLNRKK